MINKYLLYTYYILSALGTYFLLKTPFKNYNNSWLCKSILLYIAFIVFLVSIFYNNKIINNYLLPFLLFINIAILFVVTLKHKIKIQNILLLLGLLYLLCTFNYKDFKFKNGYLKNPNKKWIYSYVFFLILYFMVSDFIINKIVSSLLLLYPLLFPLNQYYIHRIFTLFIILTFYSKFMFNIF